MSNEKLDAIASEFSLDVASHYLMNIYFAVNGFTCRCARYSGRRAKP